MKADKVPQQKSQSRQTKDNPLADIAGKFGSEFWLSTQSEIEKSRQRDKEENKKLLETELKLKD